MPPTQSLLGLLEACWQYFSLLGASWALFAHLAAFLVACGRFFCVLGRSGLDFRGFLGTPGKVLDVPRPRFSRFLRAREHAMRNMLDVYETPLKLMRNAYRPSSAQRKERAKIDSTASCTELSAKSTWTCGTGAHGGRL